MLPATKPLTVFLMSQIKYHYVVLLSKKRLIKNAIASKQSPAQKSTFFRPFSKHWDAEKRKARKFQQSVATLLNLFCCPTNFLGESSLGKNG